MAAVNPWLSIRALPTFAWAICACGVACFPLAWVDHALSALRTWQLVLHPLLFLVLAFLRFRPLEGPGPSRRLVFASATIALLWVLGAQALHYFALTVNGVDFSIFDWMLHSTLEGRFMYSPIYAVNHFGVHPSYWMLALVPIHALWPSPLMLSAVTGLVVWGACFPLWRLVLGRTGNSWVAWLACLAYLTCAWTGRLIDGGFRPEVLYPLAGFLFLLSWERKRWLLGAALLFLSIKEDAAVYLAGFAVAAVLADARQWRAGVGLLLLSVTVLWVNIAWVQPAALASAGTGQPTYVIFWADYGRTMPEVVRFMLLHPLRVAQDVLGSSWWTLLAPLAFLPLFSLRSLGMLLPGLVLLGSAVYPRMRGFQMYYPIPLLAPALWGAVEATSSRWARRYPQCARTVLVTVLLAFPLFWFGYVRLPVPRLALHQEVAALDRSDIPGNGPLCAQTSLFPHLSYELRPTPLFEPACLDQPGSWALIHLELAPFPLDRAALEALVAEALRSGRARQLPEGTWMLSGPPS